MSQANRRLISFSRRRAKYCFISLSHNTYDISQYTSWVGPGSVSISLFILLTNTTLSNPKKGFLRDYSIHPNHPPRGYQLFNIQPTVCPAQFCCQPGFHARIAQGVTLSQNAKNCTERTATGSRGLNLTPSITTLLLCVGLLIAAILPIRA